MNIKTKRTTKWLIVLSTVILLSITCFTLMSRNSFVASASSVNSYDAYTNDDYFQFEGNRHSIREYPTLSQPSRGNVGKQNWVGMAGSYFTLNLGTKDDAIAQIVPRELFTYSNETLHIGDQYGFFISTTPMGSAGNFCSTVIVFDISTKNDLLDPPDRIVLEVEPIFQCKYAYLKAGSGSVSFQYEEKSYYFGIQTSSNIVTKTLSYSNLSNDRIIAMPSRAEEVTDYGLWGDWTTTAAVFYNNANDYYLKDISFSASLSNVDKLNHGDNGYNPSQDDGWFIIDFQCNLGGRYYVNNTSVLDNNVIYNNIYNTFKFIAGFTPASPVIDVMDGIELIGDWFKVANHPSVTEYIIDNRDFLVEEFFTSRANQLNGYRDAYGNPMLIKTASLATNSDSTPNGVAVWFNARDGSANDSVVARIIVAHGAANAGQAFSTNLRKEIAMSVVRASDGQTVKTETSSYNSRLGYSKNGLVIENNVVTGYVSGELGNAVEIPEGVTAIGNNAFSGAAFSDIIIPNTFTSIGNSVFANQAQLSQISIPSSVKEINSVAFQGCVNLQAVTFAGTPQLQTIGNSAFYNCTSLSQITIPSSVTSIKQDAFLNSGIWNNTANNSVVYAGNWVVGFKGTLNTSITLNSNTRGISDFAFSYQTGLTGANLPNSITIIGNHAFYNCTNLSNINLSSNLTSIGDHAFRQCRKLAAIALPDNLISIGNLAFEYCLDLKSITIPLSVTTIGYEAFSGCSNLTIYAKAVTKPSGWSATWNLSNCPVVWSHNGLMWQVVPNGQLVVGRPTRVSLDFWITTASSYGDDSSTDLYRIALEFTNSITINGGTLGLIQATVSNNGYITLSWTNYYDSNYSAYLDSWGITSGTYIEQYF